MITKRPSAARGGADHGWLETRHTFSFADYRDPAHTHFRALRVINEDWIAPGTGFGTHPHNDMEILTYPVSGSLAHRDSLGNGSVIRPGEIQRMSAGTGVLHSEHNASDADPVHLLQIWIFPEGRNLAPGYEQSALPEPGDGLQVIASRDGRGDGVTLHQDVTLYRGKLPANGTTSLALAADRHAWVQVIEGSLQLNDTALAAGDGAAVSDLRELSFAAGPGGAHLLVFDLA